MILEEITSEEYQKFLDKEKSVDFLQSVQQGNRMHNQGWKVAYVRASENGEAKAAAMLCMIPLMKVFRYCYVPRGFFCDYHDEATVKEFTQLLKQYLKKQNVVYMEMDPLIILQQRDKNGDIVEGGINNQCVVDMLKEIGYEQLPLKTGYDLSKECRFISALDISIPEDQILKNFVYQARRNIRTTEKNCVKIVELDRNGLKLVDEMEKKTSERHQFNGFSMQFYETVIDAFGKENTFIPYAYLDVREYHKHVISEYEHVRASIEETKAAMETSPSVSKQKKLKNDQDTLNALEKKLKNAVELQEKYGDEIPLAAAFFLKYRDQIYYLVGASEYEFRAYHGPYAIQWYMMRKAKELGCTRYNFYGISGYFKEGEEGYGVFDFKRGFNAVVEEYIGNFILPVEPTEYKLYRKLKKHI